MNHPVHDLVDIRFKETVRRVIREQEKEVAEHPYLGLVLQPMIDELKRLL